MATTDASRTSTPASSVPPLRRSTTHPADTGRGSDPMRRTAFLGGALYVLTFLSSIPAVLLLDPVLGDTGYVIGAGADTQIAFASVLDVVNALALIGTAVVLFPVIKRQSEVLAVGFATSRLLEAAILFIGIVSLMAVVTLRQDLGGAAGSDQDALVSVAAALVAVRDWAFLFGTGMAVANALLLGSAVYRARLVPRVIPLMGLVGAPLLLAANTGILFGVNEQFSVWSMIALPGIFFWELSFGIYLMVKGFKPTSPLFAGTDR